MALTDYDPNAICTACGRKAAEHEDWQHADAQRKLAAQAQERADFDAKVAERVAQKVAFRRLVEYKAAQLRDPNQKAIPRPRTPGLDAPKLPVSRRSTRPATSRTARGSDRPGTEDGERYGLVDPSPGQRAESDGLVQWS